MRAILQELIFAAQLQIVEAIGRAPFMWIQRSKGLTDFNSELRRNTFGDIDRNIRLARPTVIRCPDRADSRQRKFVGDERVVGGKRCLEKSRARKAMTIGPAHCAELAHCANEPKDQS